MLFVAALLQLELLELPVAQSIEDVALLHAFDELPLVVLLLKPQGVELLLEQLNVLTQLLVVRIAPLQRERFDARTIAAALFQLSAILVLSLKQLMLFGFQLCELLLSLLQQVLAVAIERFQAETKTCHRLRR